MEKISRRNLMIYAITQAISRFGDQFQFMAVTSLTYQLTGSPLLTTLQMSCSALPFIILARKAGTLADRYDPRRLTSIALAAQAALTLGYTMTSDVRVILILNLMISSFSVFISAARTVLIPQMVGRAQVFKANARLASISGAAMLIAPAAAGIIMARVGSTWAFVFNSISYLFPAIGVCLIRPVEPVRTEKQAVDSLKPVLLYLRTHPDFSKIVGLFMAYSVGMWSVNALFYPFVKDILGAGTDVLGVNVSMYFGAYLLTGVVLERWGEHLKHPLLLPAGYLVGAVIWTGYTMTRSIPICHLLSAFDGVVFTYTMTRLDTQIQAEAPAEIRGRIGALTRAADEVATITGQLGGGAIATTGGILNGMRWSSAVTFGLVALLTGLAGVRPRIPRFSPKDCT